MTEKKNVVHTQIETSGTYNCCALAPLTQGGPSPLLSPFPSQFNGKLTMVQLNGVGLYKSNCKATIAVVNPIQTGITCIRISIFLLI